MLLLDVLYIMIRCLVFHHATLRDLLYIRRCCLMYCTLYIMLRSM